MSAVEGPSDVERPYPDEVDAFLEKKKFFDFWKAPNFMYSLDGDMLRTSL